MQFTYYLFTYKLQLQFTYYLFTYLLSHTIIAKVTVDWLLDQPLIVIRNVIWQHVVTLVDVYITV